ncbi:MAG: patatin-like phospholipase family protein [Firmicutes bacterium]|nr:patatin-like phospholipase family protein [Bacillota bacterium]
MRPRLPDRVGVALGGGVVRGLAHIGVLQVLEELGVRIEYIAGTSCGAVIGGLYAAGVPLAGMMDIALHARWRDLAEISVRRDGLIGTRKLAAHLDSIIGGKRFEDLDIPFAAVATDICTGEEVLINSGPVSEAIRASCSIPGIFVPVKMGGRMLVDGGLCNNVPTSVTRAIGADYVVAVELNSRGVGGPPPKNVFQIILHAHDIIQRTNVDKEVRDADVLIQPDLSGLSLIDFAAAREFIRRGREAAEQAFAVIE